MEIGGKRAKRIAVAREEQAGTELEISVLERNLRRRTREAFFRSLAARDQAIQSQATLALSSRIKDIVQQRFNAGDVAEIEVIQADVELARAEADYEMVQQTEKSADVLLGALLNRKFDDHLQLDGRLDDLPSAIAMESVIDTALHSNPDVQKFTQQYTLEQRRLELAKAQRIPNLDLQGGVDFNSPPTFRRVAADRSASPYPSFIADRAKWPSPPRDSNSCA